MKKKGQRGMALVTAMAAALIVSIIAAVVLNMTFRRFEMAAFRSDRAVAATELEAGLRYAFDRLDRDSAFRTAVQNKTPPGDYILRCHDDLILIEDLPLIPQLHLGTKIGPVSGTYLYDSVNNPSGKHVTVLIRYDPAGAGGAARPYAVRARTDYGTGN